MSDLTLTKYGKTYPVRLRVQTYDEYRNLCVSREVLTDGYWEPWDTVTVNVTARYGGPCFALIDVNNCGEDCVDWLVSNGFGVRTPGGERSGFCFYPEFMFFEQKLREQDPEGLELHIELWNACHAR